MKKQSKQIKKILKREKKIREYKKTFKNKKMRFIVTSINEIFEGNTSTYEWENKLITCANDIYFWEHVLREIGKQLIYNNDVKWNELGKFLFYTYHQSEYYIKKSKLNNIYNQSNFIQINNLKKECYDAWIKSLYLNADYNFNKYVIKFLRLIK